VPAGRPARVVGAASSPETAAAPAGRLGALTCGQCYAKQAPHCFRGVCCRRRSSRSPERNLSAAQAGASNTACTRSQSEWGARNWGGERSRGPYGGLGLSKRDSTVQVAFFQSLYLSLPLHWPPTHNVRYIEPA
jgi:hypothetical protein